MKVLTFSPPPKEDSPVNQDLIAMLEGLLEWAKTGDITSAAIVMKMSDGSTANCFDASCPILLLGEMRAMERDILDICVDGRLHGAGDEY